MSTDIQAQKDDREAVSTIYITGSLDRKGGGKGMLTGINVYFSFPEFVEVWNGQPVCSRGLSDVCGATTISREKPSSP